MKANEITLSLHKYDELYIEWLAEKNRLTFSEELNILLQEKLIDEIIKNKKDFCEDLGIDFELF